MHFQIFSLFRLVSPPTGASAPWAVSSPPTLAVLQSPNDDLKYIPFLVRQYFLKNYLQAQKKNNGEKNRFDKRHRFHLIFWMLLI